MASMRRHRPRALLAWVSVTLVAVAAGALAAHLEHLAAVWWAASLLGLVLTLLLVVAIVDDDNAAGRRGGLWGLLFLVTGGLTALLWAFDSRLPAPSGEPSGNSKM